MWATLRVTCVAAGVAAAAYPVVGQTARFEVAAVRINQERDARLRVQPSPNGTFLGTAMTLRDLIRFAYQIEGSRVVGGPAWMDTTRFDITARATQPVPGGPNAMRPLVRDLLADRFRLRIRAESREIDAFVLRRLNETVPLPPGLQPSQSGCDGVTADERRASTRPGWPACGLADIRNVPIEGSRAVTTTVRRSAHTIDEIAMSLVSTVGKPVVDQTRLEGRFDVEYTYVRSGPDSPAGDPLPEGPTMLVAFEEQLGLRVEARRVPLPVIVIDDARMPMLD